MSTPVSSAVIHRTAPLRMSQMASREVVGPTVTAITSALPSFRTSQSPLSGLERSVISGLAEPPEAGTATRVKVKPAPGGCVASVAMTVVSAGCQFETSGFKYLATVGSEVGTCEVVGDGRDVIGCPGDGDTLDVTATASVDDPIGAAAGVHALASARTAANHRRRLNAVTIAHHHQDRNESSCIASTPSRQEARLYPAGPLRYQ